MRPTKAVLPIECVLSNEDKLNYSRDLANAISKMKRAQDRSKSFSAQIKAEIQAYDATINLLSEKINAGKEFRDVECRIEYDWDKKTKSWFRIDTGEIVAEDIITEKELQEELID